MFHQDVSAGAQAFISWNIMLVRVIQITAHRAHVEEKRVKFLENVVRDFKACQIFVDLWEGDVVIPRLRILYWKPGFQEKSLVIVSVMSNNSDISKIHLVVVFVDMTGGLAGMVKHRNSPFVFRNSSFKWSFSLTVVYKTAVDATDFVHCARLCPVKLFQGFRSREQIVHSSQWFEGDFDLLLP